MKKLVLVRHGESEWNKENRFTGWTDVELSDKGRAEAKEAGEVLREGGYTFDVAYTSVLKRAIHTLWTRAGRDGSGVDSGASLVALERAPLRRAARAEQSRDGGEVRRGAGEDLAAELRYPAAGTDAGRRALPRPRPPLRRLEQGGACR